MDTFLHHGTVVQTKGSRGVKHFIMESRIKELEDLTASLEKQVWALTNIVQMLAEDAIDKVGSEWSQEEKKQMKALLKKI